MIGAYIETIDETPEMAFHMTEKKIMNNVKGILEISRETNVSPRETGMKMAKERVIMAMKAKGIWKNG